MGVDKFYRPVVMRSGDAMYNLRISSWTGTPSSVAANKAEEQAWTVSGVTTADYVVSVNSPGLNDDCAPVSARVSAANTVTIAFTNPTASTSTPKTGTYSIILIRKQA